MRPTLTIQITLALLLTTLTGLSQALFFSDNFSSGSTLTNATPAVPTANSCNYDLISSKNWSPAPSLAVNDLRFGIADSSSGSIEMQAIFSTNPVALSQAGDYIQLTVVFTNTAGILSTNQANLLGIGLYSSGQTNPILGGMQGTATSSSTQPGGANQWVGYVGQVVDTNGSVRIMTRALQTTTTANNQDLVENGSSSLSYNNPPGGTIGSTTTSVLEFTNGNLYTEVLTIQLLAAGSEAITNAIYNGNSTNAPLMQVWGATNTGSTYLTSVFDSLAVGWRAVNHPGQTTIDITSLSVQGHSTAITGPPLITAQPTPTIAATNGYAQFTVGANGFNVTYQWFHNGSALSNVGDIAGAQAPTLAISPAESGDVGPYYCKVTGFGGYSTNTVTNSLTLVASTNLIWTGANGSPPNWDVGTTPNWVDTNGNPELFIGGDAVSFNDSAVDKDVALVGNVAPSSISLTTGTSYTLAGSGSIVGPCSMILSGTGPVNSGVVTLSPPSGDSYTYSGGTILTNGVYVEVDNEEALGTGPVILNDEGGTMDITNTGSATIGINGDIHVNSDFTFQVDGSGTFSAVFFGNITGSSAYTLTLNAGSSSSNTNRIRLYGTNTVCSNNIAISGPSTTQAQYYGSEIAPYNPSGLQIYYGVISGNGGVIERGNGIAVMAGQNTYTGGTTPSAGTIGIGADSVGTPGSVTSGPFGTGIVMLAPEVPGTTGTGTILSYGAAHTLGNSLVYPSGTNNLQLAIGGTNNITFSGPFGLNGADALGTATNRTVSVTTNVVATFSGVISDSGLGYGLIKSGGGAMSLHNSETYTGPTIVNGGNLLVDGSISSSSPVLVQTNGVLGGIGTIPSSVTVSNGGALMAGDLAIGTLTINNTLTFLSTATNIVQVSHTGGLHDLVNVTTAVYNGNLYVTNLAGTVSLTDTYKIFNATSESGSFTNIIGTPGPGLAWVFTPSTGFLSVTQTTITPTIPPTISSFTLSGANASITATNGVNGGTYYLLGTASLAPPVTWVPVATNVVTASGGSETFNFIGTNVFSVGTPQKFFELSSTNN